MFTPREMAATPSTRNVSTTTLPIPTRALTAVCDTSTAREDPEPCGTSMTVQRRSAFLRIALRTTSREHNRPGAKAPVPAWYGRMENPDRAWGPVPSVEVNTTGWTESVNTTEREADHRLW